MATEQLESATVADKAGTYKVPRNKLSNQRFFFFLFVILIPIGGTFTAVSSLPFIGFSYLDAVLLAAFYCGTAIGVEVGYHRCFTHRSFVPNALLKYILAILGSMALQGTVGYWVSHHRRHHEHTDQEGDPHSPHVIGDEPMIFRFLRGLLHSHIGWIFSSVRASPGRYARDIVSDTILSKVDRNYKYWAIASLAVSPLIAITVDGSLLSALRAFLWGSCVRIFLVQQMTFGVNSLAHLLGTRPFVTTDKSHNVPLINILTFGGYLHNNHHAYPSSANSGRRWYDFDFGAGVIFIFQMLGMAKNVKWTMRESSAKDKRFSGVADD